MQNFMTAWRKEMASALFYHQMEFADSLTLSSADGQGETLEELNSLCT